MSDRDSICDRCTQHSECSNLKMATLILEGQLLTIDKYYKKRKITGFLRTIENHGYRFPFSSKACLLAESRGRIRGLTKKAISLICRKY